MTNAWSGSRTAALFVGLLCVAGCGDGTPPVLGDVRLTEPPSDRAPLAARLTASTDEPAVVTLTVDDGTRQWSVTPSAEPRVDHSVLVLGLHPDSTHEVVLTATDAAGNVSRSAPTTIVTDPLPDDFPPFEVTVSDPERSEPGVTLFALMRWPDGGQPASEGIIVMVDASGEGCLVSRRRPIHHRSLSPRQRTPDVYRWRRRGSEHDRGDRHAREYRGPVAPTRSRGR